ncbi:antitoxin MazE family protein [Parapusillimonas sp. JC17]|uniref:antitoxin MazE family protein n=1 Tax=Parapusillimonas sp. JC17 TaxID=3445768 RepID=UPI003FA124CE
MADASADKVARHRSRLRASGLRPLQIWVPDTRDADYARRIRNQCIALRNDAAELEVLAFAEAAANDIQGWK